MTKVISNALFQTKGKQEKVAHKIGNESNECLIWL